MNKKKIGLGSIAAAGAAALVMGLGTPAMAAVSPTFGSVVVGGPASVTLPKTGSTDVPLSVAFNGPAPVSGISYSTSTSTALVSRNNKIKASYVWTKPSISQTDYNQPVTPAAAKAYKLALYSNITTPGVYRATASVKKYQGGGEQVVSGAKLITVKANTGFSKARTYATGSPKYGRSFKVKVYAPYYQVGAKVSAYVKLPGKKKYKKVTSGYLKSSSSSSSKASLTIKSKYNKNKARFYFKVAAAPYAGSYKTTTYKITVRRY